MQDPKAYECKEDRKSSYIPLTGLFQRNNGVAPISFATIAQVVGPTYALTAALSTRVGRWG